MPALHRGYCMFTVHHGTNLGMSPGFLSQISFKTVLLPILNLGLEKEISILENVFNFATKNLCKNPDNNNFHIEISLEYNRHKPIH